MPYAYGANISHAFRTDHLVLWLTFRNPMDQTDMPGLDLWVLNCDAVEIDIIDSSWLDEFTLNLISDTVASNPSVVTLEFLGPTLDLRTTWGKQWEPFGPLQSNVSLVFENRGDPAAADFTQVDLTTDGSWHELDLSGIVPVGAKAVLLTFGIVDNAANSIFRFRKKGNVNIVNITEARTQVANVAIYTMAVCAVDEERKIEYYGSNVVFTGIAITVSGWWF
jgi:hypothetical protein